MPGLPLHHEVLRENWRLLPDRSEHNRRIVQENGNAGAAFSRHCCVIRPVVVIHLHTNGIEARREGSLLQILLLAVSFKVEVVDV